MFHRRYRRDSPLVLVLSMLCALTVFAERPAVQEPSIIVLTPQIPGVVADNAVVEIIGSGFSGTEGPVALGDGSLLFTEPRANRITRIDNGGNVSTFLEDTNVSNALGFDSDGRLISVQRGAGQTQVGVLYPEGSERVLVDSFRGEPFVRPNDLVVSGQGGVYFTDGPGIYYIPPGGEVILVADGFQNPNGVILSPDENIVYANNEFGEYVLAFDVEPDGSLGNRRDFARYQSRNDSADGSNEADGIAIDAEGRVYVATALGVEIFSPRGEHLGTIMLSESPQNLAFAGPEKRALYVVGRGTVLKIQMLAQGFRGRAK
jgi:gluconolactonase